jgi:hypothetical protein
MLTSILDITSTTIDVPVPGLSVSPDIPTVLVLLPRIVFVPVYSHLYRASVSMFLLRIRYVALAILLSMTKN